MRQTSLIISTVAVRSSKTILTFFIIPAGLREVRGYFLGKIFNLTAFHYCQTDLLKYNRSGHEAALIYRANNSIFSHFLIGRQKNLMFFR